MQNIKILYLYDDLFMNNIMKYFFILSYDHFLLLLRFFLSTIFFLLLCIWFAVGFVSVVITLQIIIIGNAMTLWIGGINIFHLKLHNLYTIFSLPLLAPLYDMMNVCSVIFNRFFLYSLSLSLSIPLDKIHDIRTHTHNIQTSKPMASKMRAQFFI